jgi:hypothetical protein
MSFDYCMVLIVITANAVGNVLLVVEHRKRRSNHLFEGFMACSVVEIDAHSLAI